MKYKSKIFKQIIVCLVFLLIFTSITTRIGYVPKNKNPKDNRSITDDLKLSQDDNYEPNNEYYEAFNLSLHEGTWLSAIDGLGIQEDYDWYEIYITSGETRLIVSLDFTHADGNINLHVFDSSGSFVVASSYSFTDDEFIDCVLSSSGTYYLCVYFDDAGNEYNLWWDDFNEDNYEENDDFNEAYDLSSYEATWLSTIDGMGVQGDIDIFEIYITPGYERLIVNCTFTHAEGNIELEVFDSDFDCLFFSRSNTDNEYINATLDESGTYYILIDNALYIDMFSEYDLWWDDIPLFPEDNYEENDISSQAYNLSSYEGTWLSAINGQGIQADDDWYEVYIDFGYNRLVVELLFTHTEGNIDIEVYNSSFDLITYSDSITDNEYINYILPSNGIYYLLIYYDNQGTLYDLRWDDLLTDDNYEPNDTYWSAYNISSYEGTWLSAIDGLGIQADNDWYEICIDPGNERLVINLTFTHAEGNIQLEVYDSNIDFITYSHSITDNEYIDYIVPSSGTYYLLIWYNPAGNEYDLWWDDLPVIDAPISSTGGGGGGGGGGDEESIPGYNVFILIGAVCVISIILVKKRLKLKCQD